VKNGDWQVRPEKYLELIKDESDELWLISTLGSIYKIDSNEKESQSIVRYRRQSEEINTQIFSICELIEFALNSSKNNILPNSISKWQRFFK
jgi:hypothetical protein